MENANRFIIWQDDYSVGVQSLDDQHKQVIDVINAIYGIRNDTFPKEELAAYLLKLQLFTETHFHYEEVVMRFANYPNYEEHRLLHHGMIERTAKICAHFRSDVYTDTDEVFMLLKNWWLNHIRGEDQGYRKDVEKLKL